METYGKIAKFHEQGLPNRVDWGAVRTTVLQCLAEVPYPPERFWAIDPRGGVRGAWVGDEESVTIPFRDLGKLYQAVLIHSHPPGYPPTVDDVYHAVIAASPLLIVIEGETAHLLAVWHDRSPGYMGALLWDAPDLATALNRVGGSWTRSNLAGLGEAIQNLGARWNQFLAEQEG
jgi:hypothetical protein